MNQQLRRLVLDLGPLLVFFIAFRLGGFFAATAAFMVAIGISLVLGWVIERKLSPMPLFTAILVMVFGGLTLYLKNETFLKVKVTILYLFFGVILLGGLATGRLFIKYVFAQAFDLTESGWRKLTLRWGLFCLALAALNEAVWRNLDTALWVDFKVWVILPLVFLFALAQTPLILRHGRDETKGN